MALVYCSNCGRQISDQAPVCLNCQAPNLAHQAQGREVHAQIPPPPRPETEARQAMEDRPPQPEAEVRQSTATRAAGWPGFWDALGWACMFWLILGVVGALLCLTGIGALLGIPLIFAGHLALLIMPFAGKSARVGACPYCGHQVTMSTTSSGVTCRACRRRIVMHHHRFFRV
ncbi:MAG: hypothetical protein JXQ27_14000 [Acidobacteria bacterium]|nr:hypothetical protein [Acidobacteriota bacterium]